MAIKTIIVIHCWSAPRSRSTALLYTFEARGDNCVAIDEPLYRSWLIGKGNSVSRPYLKEIIEGVPPDDLQDESDKWKRELLPLNERISVAAEHLQTGGVIFCKHMAVSEWHRTLQSWYCDKERSHLLNPCSFVCSILVCIETLRSLRVPE